jgi:hypothetical protein
MRFVLFLAMLSLAACASEKLDQAPPAGVDFSGRWSLNAADSDDPQRLVQAQSDTPSPAAQSGAPQGGSGGRGRRGGGAGGMNNFGAPSGGLMPPVSALGDGLRWPGKQLEIKQVAGIVAFSSDGYNRICEPQKGSLHRHHTGNRGGSGRDAPRARDAPPPRCGWLDKTLIVQGGDPDDDHSPFEEQYSLSEDGRRLVEVVSFKEGRSSGFTMSRVWDRAPK